MRFRVVVVGCFLLWTNFAHAQIDDEADSAARSFYEAGVTAYTSGRYEVALNAFRQGYALSERPRFLFNIASALDRMHQLEEALAMYRQYEAALPNSPNQAVVDRRVAFLTQAIEAEDALAHEAARERAQAAQAEADSSSFVSAPAVAGYVVAASGLITMVVASVVANSQFSDLEHRCAPNCSDEDLSSVRTSALIADIGLGVAVAGITFALLYGLVADGSDDAEPAVEIAASTSGAELIIGGTF